MRFFEFHAIGLLGAFLAFAPQVGAQCAPTSLTTQYARNNGGSNGGAVYFDITVNLPIEIVAYDTNTLDTVPFTYAVHVTAQGVSAFGNEANLAAWTQVAVDDGTAVGQGANIPTRINLLAPFRLTTGTYGMALVIGPTAGHDYTNGTGANQAYSDANISLALGSASNVAFSGTPFNPRVWNGSIYYCACDGSVRFSGQGCADATATTLSLSSMGCPDRGETFGLQLNAGAASIGPVYFIVGLSNANWLGIQLPLDLSPFGAPGCSLYTSQEIVIGPINNPGGGAGIQAIVPQDPTLTLGTSYWQGLMIEPANSLPFVTTNYATIIFG